MFNFFCLSKNEEDLVLATHAVASISQKLNTVNILYVNSVPSWAARYKSVDFVDDLPLELRRASRRPVHHSVIENEESAYLNAWVSQRRNYFVEISNGSKIAAACKMANELLKNLGIRKRVTRQNFLDVDFVDNRKYVKVPFSFEGKIFAVLNFDNDYEQFKNLMSAMDVFGFYSAWSGSDNVSQYTGLDEKAFAIANSDVVVAEKQILLLPFYGALEGKKIVLTGETSSDLIFSEVEITQGSIFEHIRRFNTLSEQKK